MVTLLITRDRERMDRDSQLTSEIACLQTQLQQGVVNVL